MAEFAPKNNDRPSVPRRSAPKRFDGQRLNCDTALCYGIVTAASMGLMTRWDGASIICSVGDSRQESVSMAVVRAYQFAPRLLLVVICFMLLGISSRNFSRTRTSRLFFVTVISASAAFCWQMLDSSSLLRNLDAARWMAADSEDSATISRCERPYTEILNEKRPFVLVDARPVPYCQIHTLPGARLAGIELHLDEMRLRLRDVGKYTPIVVYCQSNQCQWAELVAKRIRATGFQNTSVFVPGVNGIQEYLAIQAARVQRDD